MGLQPLQSHENGHLNSGAGPLARSRLPSRLCARKPDQRSGADEGAPQWLDVKSTGRTGIFDGAVSGRFSYRLYFFAGDRFEIQVIYGLSAISNLPFREPWSSQYVRRYLGVPSDSKTARFSPGTLTL